MGSTLFSSYRVERVDGSAEPVLGNLFEHYLHDMAEWFLFDAHEDGLYHFSTERVWQDGYHVHLLYSNQIPVGFALVGTADEFLERSGVHDMDEFFVARRHRGRGLGKAFAAHLWAEYPGEWLVRVFQANLPAMPFWRAAISAHTAGRFDESVRSVKEAPWSYFTFESCKADS
jgi:predicted acetyltransferase